MREYAPLWDLPAGRVLQRPAGEAAHEAWAGHWRALSSCSLLGFKHGVASPDHGSALALASRHANASSSPYKGRRRCKLYTEVLMQDINPILNKIGELKGRVQSLRGYL